MPKKLSKADREFLFQAAQVLPDLPDVRNAINVEARRILYATTASPRRRAKPSQKKR